MPIDLSGSQVIQRPQVGRFPNRETRELRSREEFEERYQVPGEGGPEPTPMESESQGYPEQEVFEACVSCRNLKERGYNPRCERGGTNCCYDASETPYGISELYSDDETLSYEVEVECDGEWYDVTEGEFDC